MSDTDVCGCRSYKQFYEDEVSLPTVAKNPKGMTYRPKLVPYRMGSIVNQLPVRFDNEPLHGVRFCAPRNASQFEYAPAPPRPAQDTNNRHLVTLTNDARQGSGKATPAYEIAQTHRTNLSECSQQGGAS